MSNLKRTRANFPKMKVRGAKRKWEVKLDRLIELRHARFELAMRVLASQFGPLGMKVNVTDEAIEQFKEANKRD